MATRKKKTTKRPARAAAGKTKKATKQKAKKATTKRTATKTAPRATKRAAKAKASPVSATTRRPRKKAARTPSMEARHEGVEGELPSGDGVPQALERRPSARRTRKT